MSYAKRYSGGEVRARDRVWLAVMTGLLFLWSVMFTVAALL